MPIIRSSEQPSMSLEEFYKNLSATSTNTNLDVGNRMLLMLDLLNALFPDKNIYGLTSLARLVLLAKDNSQSDWLIIVSSFGTNEYQIEYLMPEQKAPWKGARVKGTALSLEEAKDYLRIAVMESEGWADGVT